MCMPYAPRRDYWARVYAFTLTLAVFLCLAAGIGLGWLLFRV